MNSSSWFPKNFGGVLYVMREGKGAQNAPLIKVEL